ncbi:nucleoporin NSP1-like [Pomacea canaliculata]|uniref:nucleoporin NSP1-like n=1 Tax=Pomacea canaliculata TaxID=400727 RepID=UPI000D72E97C|nr:nucleoporin NSP1-like [Pomacea canaliculata]
MFDSEPQPRYEARSTSGSPANRSSTTSAMTALHLLVVVLTVVTAVAEYSPPYSPVDTAYTPEYSPDYGGKPTYAPVYDSKPDYKKPDYGRKPANPPVYDSKPDYKKPAYEDKPTYPSVYDSKPDYKKPEYESKPVYASVYDGKLDYKKPEYESKPTYSSVYDGKPDYKKPEYESKPTYSSVYDGKLDYKKPEYESKPTYSSVYDSKPDYEDKPNYDQVNEGKSYGGKLSSSLVSGADAKSASEAVRAVVNKKTELYKDLDIYETLIQVAAERLNLINQRTLPAIRLDNSQTDASISILDQEINALRDRASRADVTATAALASANASSDVIRQQRALVAQISRNNTDDARRIAQFQGDLRNLEAYFLKELDTQIGQLTSLLAKERQNLKTVTAFVDGRKCEYGYLGLWSDASTESVTFVSQFTQAPSVDIVLSGYLSFLNVPFASDRYPSGSSYPPQSTYGDDTKGYDSSYKNDAQNVQIVASDVTTHGFTAKVINSSPANFYFARVRARYVACQNLYTEVHL